MQAVASKTPRPSPRRRSTAATAPPEPDLRLCDLIRGRSVRWASGPTSSTPATGGRCPSVSWRRAWSGGGPCSAGARAAWLTTSVSPSVTPWRSPTPSSAPWPRGSGWRRSTPSTPRAGQRRLAAAVARTGADVVRGRPSRPGGRGRRRGSSWTASSTGGRAGDATGGDGTARAGAGRRRPVVVGHDRPAQGGPLGPSEAAPHGRAAWRRTSSSTPTTGASTRCRCSTSTPRLSACCPRWWPVPASSSTTGSTARASGTSWATGRSRGSTPCRPSSRGWASPAPDETVPVGIRFIRSASAPLPVATADRFEASTGIPVSRPTA